MQCEGENEAVPGHPQPVAGQIGSELIRDGEGPIDDDVSASRGCDVTNRPLGHGRNIRHCNPLDRHILRLISTRTLTSDYVLPHTPWLCYVFSSSWLSWRPLLPASASGTCFTPTSHCQNVSISEGTLNKTYSLDALLMARCYRCGCRCLVAIRQPPWWLQYDRGVL